MRVAGALIVAAHASGVAGGLLLLVFLILLVLPPGAPGWWVPLLRGVVGFVGIVAVGPGARVKVDVMAGGTQVTDSAAAAAQFLVATIAGRLTLYATLSLLRQVLWSGRLSRQDQGLDLRHCFHHPLLPLCVPVAHLQLHRCVTLSGIWMCWAGKSLLNYGYFTSCRSKGRDTKGESQATTMPTSPTVLSFSQDRLNAGN